MFLHDVSIYRTDVTSYENSWGARPGAGGGGGGLGLGRTHVLLIDAYEKFDPTAYIELSRILCFGATRPVTLCGFYKAANGS